MLQDLRFSIRTLLKDRSFTLTALLTLALCIGANTAIFSIVRSVLLRPLPVPDSDRLVVLMNTYPNAGAVRGSTGVPDYFDRLRDMKVFDEQALYRRQGVTLGADTGAQRLVAVVATPSFFRMTQPSPVVGGLFTEQDGEENSPRRVLLSHAMWQQRFGADPAIVGREVRLSGNVHHVAGVMPQDFKYLWNDVEVWLPARFTAREKSDDSRHSNNWTMVGRLKAGATVSQAQQQVDAVNAASDQRFPEFRQILKDAGFRTIAVNLQDDLVRDMRAVLYLLWGGVLFVLLIGCVNIANLVMVRSSARAREMATRHAIGANLGRLGRQLLTETMLLSLAGGALGVLTGWWGLRSVTLLRLDELPRGHEIHLDAASVGVALALTVVVGLLIGLVPVLRLARLNVNTVLRSEGRGGTSSRATNLLRRSLATAQITIAFVLLIGAGLMLASFSKVLKIDPGFVPEGVITASINLPNTSYGDPAALTAAANRILEAARSVPGVTGAGFTTNIPFSDDRNDSVILAEGYVMKPGESLISPINTTVSEGYFEAMQVPLVHGRYFTAGDVEQAPKVVIVDERLAAKFWPGRDPIGRRMYMPEDPKDLFATTKDTRFLNVVGVVKEVQVAGPASGFPAVGAYYFPNAQSPSRGMVMAMRTAAIPESVIGAFRAKVAAIDPELPVYGVETMMERLDETLIARRVPMSIAIGFAATALLLSAVGIYGVLSYQVAERRREIGIRMALGSTTREVFGLVLRDGVTIVGTGLLLGLAGTYFVGRAMVSQLYEVAPMDPMVIATVSGVMVLVALAATLIPARRAARVSPLVALSD